MPKSLLLTTILVVFSILGSATTPLAADRKFLFEPFRGRGLSYDEKIFLQTSLAFEGHYVGLLDGDWGPKSKQAIQQYTRQKYKTATENWHMAMLVLEMIDRVEKEGWEFRYFAPLGMSFLFPAKTTILDDNSELFVNWRHRHSSLSFSVGVLNTDKASGVHTYTEKQHHSSKPVYKVRKTNFAVTSATARDGSSLYTRSNFVNGAWSTVMISAKSADRRLLNAVASSISVGRSRPLSLDDTGIVMSSVSGVIEIFKEDEEVAASSRGEKTEKDKKRSRGSGSGFWVSKENHLMTNAHVVEGCSDLIVEGKSARLLHSSFEFDLAILKIDGEERSTFAKFALAPVRLNSDVTVAGYPYAGVLGGLNITRGAVSSLKGLNGEPTRIQISAPVQSGNSGGPLIDNSGGIVGVVVSKLDALKVVDFTGDLPQNVNFAVSGEIAKLFLSQNGITPSFVIETKELAPVQLAENAAKFTTLVECR